MLQTINQQEVLTMSSLEMATLTKTRHDSAKRTIETLLNKGLLPQTQIVDGEKSVNGVIEKIYLSDKRDSLVIVARLSPEFMAAVVDRWQELENQHFTNYSILAKDAEKILTELIEACNKEDLINDLHLQSMGRQKRFAKFDGLGRRRQNGVHYSTILEIYNVMKTEFDSSEECEKWIVGLLGLELNPENKTYWTKGVEDSIDGTFTIPVKISNPTPAQKRWGFTHVTGYTNQAIEAIAKYIDRNNYERFGQYENLALRVKNLLEPMCDLLIEQRELLCQLTKNNNRLSEKMFALTNNL